jgi:hypothetical protein
MNDFTEALGLSHYTLYMQDYGGPVGFLSTRNRFTLMALCFRLLGEPTATSTAATPRDDHQHQQVTWLCPQCNGPMLILERLSALQFRFRSPPNLTTTAA